MSLKLIYFKMRALSEAPNACDFVSFHHLDLSKKIDIILITHFPRLEKFLDYISSKDIISKYLDNRTELIDISVKHKLVINSVDHPTGTNQA